MNPQRFVILLLIPFGILATAVAMLCGTILAQQGSTPETHLRFQGPSRCPPQGAEWQQRSDGTIVELHLTTGRNCT